MAAAPPDTLLREGLLDGRRIAVAAAPEPGQEDLAQRLRQALGSLGAALVALPLAPAASAEEEEAAVGLEMAGALARLGGLDVLVVESSGLLARGEGDEALLACLGSCWSAARAAAEQALIAQPEGGRIVLLAPAPSAGEHAGPAVAALENLARTLSIEWARHAVTTVAVAPHAAEVLPLLVAYLASPAGAYFSGCLLDLRGV